MKKYTKNRLVYGIGINDVDYFVQPRVNGRTTFCPFYQCWQNMLLRCCSEAYQSRRPTYIGCKVCDEWLSLTAFKSWMQLQPWEGMDLDKDMIGGGKLYSPESCVFIPHALNILFNGHGSARGEWPIGVSWHKHDRKFRAYVTVNGKYKHLGHFDTADEAHAAWYDAKLSLANNYLANETNPRIRYAIECAINKLEINFMLGIDR